MTSPLTWRLAPLPELSTAEMWSAPRRDLRELTMTHYRLAGLVLSAKEQKSEGEPLLWLNSLWIPAWEDLRALLLAPRPARLEAKEGFALAWTGNSDPRMAASITARKTAYPLRYPWEILAWHELLLPRLGEEVSGSIHPAAVVEGTLRLGEGSVLLPGTVIEGFASIGAHCRIGPHAYLRGCVTVGDGCVVGHAVELKNCILGKRTHLAHLSYAGDSLLGDDVNVGGGSIFSNYRHDGAPHRMNIDGVLMNTGCVKLGCVIGDHARLGANTTVYPGRIIPAGETTRPGSIVR